MQRRAPLSARISARHDGPSKVTVEWLAGRFLVFDTDSAAGSVLRQFEIARTHSKMWVMEDRQHRLHIIEPAAVRYLRIEPAGGAAADERRGSRRSRAADTAHDHN